MNPAHARTAEPLATAVDRSDGEDSEWSAPEIAHSAAFAQISPDPVVEVDLAGTITYANPSAERQFPDLRRRSTEHPWLTDWRTLTRTATEESRGTIAREVQIGDRWFDQIITFLANPARLRIQGVDITERKRAEHALAAKSALLEAQVEASIDGIFVVDDQGRQVLRNARFAGLMGLSDDLLEGADGQKTLQLLTTRVADPDGFVQLVRSVHANPAEVRRDEIALVSGVTLDCYTCPIVGKDGTRFGRFWSVRDITESKAAQARMAAAHAAAEDARAELESTNQQLEAAVLQASELIVRSERDAHDKTALFAAIPSVLIGLDANDRVLQWNPAAEETLGVCEADAVGRELTECGAALDWTLITEAIGRCRETQSRIRLDDVPFRTPDGRDGILGLSLNAIASSTPGAISVLILGADVTERRALEGQLAQAQKLESIGQLAAGIAHEINTPIQFVADNLAFLDDAFREALTLVSRGRALAEQCRASGVALEALDALDQAGRDADWEYLETEIPSAIAQSKEGVERVAGIVQAMKEFSHPGVEAKVCIDLNHAITTTVTVARHEWRYAAEVQLDLAPNLPPIPCYPGEINQVMLNLIVNAAHAIAAVSAETGEKGHIRVTTRLDGDFVEIQVADTGSGIPEAIRHRVFDPFFTTKEVGRGTGQGLAIAHSVVVGKHGGSIRFESKLGVGTTFYVRLPISEESR
jgi:PAS domain S-box-containing protein